MNITRIVSKPAVLVALSSAAFVFSFPPHRFSFLPWFALVPLLIALREARSAASAARMAAAWGLLSAYGITDWLPRAVANYYQQPFLLGLGLFVAATVLMGSLQYALFAAACHRPGRLRPASPLFVASAWVAAELGRCRLFGGNPWGLVGYALANPNAPDASTSAADWLLRLPVQIADLGGVYAVSFVVVAWNAAVADALIALRRPRFAGGPIVPGPPQRADGTSRAMRNVAVTLVLALSSAVYGSFRLVQLDQGNEHATRVAIVQGNVELGATWRAELYGRNFDVYLEGTAGVLDRSPALVVWPENSMSFFADDEPLYRNAIGRLLAPSGTELLAGGPSHTPGSTPQYFNSAFLFSPAGSILARYDKQHLLPFAEHFPFGAIAYLRRSFGRVREFTPGSPSAPLPTAAGQAGVLVCNEIMYPQLANARVRDGAEFLVNLSNDTWISDRAYSLGHLAIGAIRAIETRRTLVRASTSGPSAFVDATGKVTVVSPSDQRAVLDSLVVPRSGLTPYVRSGDLFALACLLVVLGRAVALRRTHHVRDG